MSNDRPVSACLLSWKRPQNLQEIVDSLHPYEFVDEILIWNNNPEVELALRGEKVRVLPSDQNMGCYGRFLCAKKARNDIVYVQDDDVLVRNVPALYQSFLGDDARITHALSGGHLRRRERYVYADGQIALLGWGAFFRRAWLDVLDVCLETYGVDALFKREADKFFSLLLGQRHQILPSQVQTLKGASTPGIALYREAQHRLMKALAVRRALELRRRSRSVRYPVTWHVVIPCHNYGKFLQEAVGSILLNDADYVVTIVDDASTDNTAGVAGRLSREYPHISYLRHDQHVGLSHARNSGIASVESLFVVLLDADDKIGPNYLYEAEKLLRSGCDVANPDAILFGDRRARWRVPDTVSLEMLLRRNHVHYCAAFRRCYWAQVGGIDENTDYWEDYDFWIRVAEAGARIRKLPGDHFYYRKHGPSRSSEAARIRDSLQARIRQKYSDLSQYRKIYCVS
jgi:hypothetical protein